MKRVLVAGIGNLFLGDDAFGVEVVRELMQQPSLPHVTIRDFGTRGLDLAYTLLAGVDALLLVDAVRRGHPPGTLTVMEPDFERESVSEDLLGPGHGVDPCRICGLVQALGGRMPKTRLLGCEPSSFGSDEEPMLALSAPVRDAVTRALPLAEMIFRELGAEDGEGAT